jgi:hypothetical protein
MLLVFTASLIAEGWEGSLDALEAAELFLFGWFRGYTDGAY